MMRGPQLLRQVMSSGQCALIYGKDMSLDLMLDRLSGVCGGQLRPLDLRIVAPAETIDSLRDRLLTHLTENKVKGKQKPLPVIVADPVDDRVLALLFDAIHGQLQNSKPARLKAKDEVPALVLLQVSLRPSKQLANIASLKVPAERFNPIARSRKAPAHAG